LGGSTTTAAIAARSPAAAAAATSTKRKKRAAGVGGPGKSLLATRGGPGVALNSPHLLLHPPPSHGTFGRADNNAPAVAAAASAPLPDGTVAKESQLRPPGPAFYNPAQAFHHVADRKTFHLNTEHRWM